MLKLQTAPYKNGSMPNPRKGSRIAAGKFVCSRKEVPCLVLHIGSDHMVARRDIVAIIDINALRRSKCAHLLHGADMSACGGAEIRSLIIAQRSGKEKIYASPVSAAALRARSVLP